MWLGWQEVVVAVIGIGAGRVVVVGVVRMVWGYVCGLCSGIGLWSGSESVSGGGCGGGEVEVEEGRC